MLKFIYTIGLIFFSSLTQASLYIYDASDLGHPLGSVSSDPGFDYALVSYVNTTMSIWRPGDVLGIVDDSVFAFRIFS